MCAGEEIESTKKKKLKTQVIETCRVHSWLELTNKCSMHWLVLQLTSGLGEMVIHKVLGRIFVLNKSCEMEAALSSIVFFLRCASSTP